MVRKLKKTLEEVDEMDQFQVITELHRFFVEDLARDELSYLKLVLKKVILEELIKVDVEVREIHNKLLKTILNLIQVKSQSFGCCLVGCRYEASRHREYVKHLRTTHPRIENIICNFKLRCARRFPTIEDLIVHIREDHSAVVADPGSASAIKSVVIDVPVKCNMASCASKQFSSIKLLMQHFNTVHKKDVRDCVFYDCEHRFCQNSDSRKHFRM